MTLEFVVNKQIIRRTDTEIPVADSVNYLKAHFVFGDDWNDPKTIIFKAEDKNIVPKTVILENDKCDVPPEVLKGSFFKVSAFCGDLHTANEIAVDLTHSGYVEGETPAEPTPGVYEQLVEMVQSVRDDAEQGKFNGADYILTEEDKGEIAKQIRADVLKIFKVSNDEEVEALVAELTDDFTSNTPCLVLSTYDGTSTSGMGIGDGLIILDDGTGDIAYSYMLPYYTNELSYNYEDKGIIDNASDFMKKYPDKTSWRSIEIGNQLGTTKYADGTEFNASPLKEVIAQFQVTYASNLSTSLVWMSLTGLNSNSVGVSIPQKLRIDGLEITANMHLFITDDSYIIQLQYITDETCLNETIVYNDTTSNFNKNKWTLFHPSTKYSLNYLYGRS